MKIIEVTSKDIANHPNLSLSPKDYIMSDAEETIKHCIRSGVIDNWHRLEKGVEPITLSIFEKLFDKTTVWAIKEYLQEIKSL